MLEQGKAAPTSAPIKYSPVAKRSLSSPCGPLSPPIQALDLTEKEKANFLRRLALRRGHYR